MSRARYTYELPEHVVEYGVKVKISELKVDTEAQRSLNEARAKGIAKGIIPDALGSIVVSQRPNGDRYVVDGMHRCRACDIAGIETITAEIHHGLDQQQEAVLFLIKNRESAKVSTLDEYKVGLTAGDALCVSVDRVLQKHSLKLGGSSTNSVGAVSAVLRIASRHGEDVLDRTLSIAEQAWGRAKESWDGMLIGGLALFLSRHGDDIDDEALAQKMMKEGLAPFWRAKVLTVSSNGGYNNSGTGSRETACYQLVRDAWNKGRKASNRL